MQPQLVGFDMDMYSVVTMIDIDIAIAIISNIV